MLLGVEPEGGPSSIVQSYRVNELASFGQETYRSPDQLPSPRVHFDEPRIKENSQYFPFTELPTFT